MPKTLLPERKGVIVDDTQEKNNIKDKNQLEIQNVNMESKQENKFINSES